MSLRLKAFRLHLLISTLLLSFFALWVLLVWYSPWPLLKLQGGVKILGLIMVIDIILGPSLTLLMIKPNKSLCERIFDMSIIILLQVLAFGYGAWTLHSERPLFLSFTEDRIDVLPAPDTDLTKIPKSISIPGFFEGSQLINIKVPDALKMEATLYRFTNNPGFAIHTELYENFPGSLSPEQFTKNTLPINEIMRNPETAEKINAFLTSHELSKEQILIFPINGRNDQAIAVFAKDGMKFLGLVDAKI